MNIKEYKEFIKNKNVGFLGIGRSNMPLIRMLSSLGTKITVRDAKPLGSFGEMADELLGLGVTLITGEDYLKDLQQHDIIYKTPVIRKDKPEILSAEQKGTVISSEMELFFELCPCKIFGVTGSDGKTTTTTLIYKMLTEEGYTCHLGGNIGKPLIGEIESIRETDFAVVELSSFQLFSMTRSPEIAAITNLSENHLDWHKDYNEYIDAKKNIFLNQDSSGILVLNADNEYTKVMGKEAKGSVRMFSLKDKVEKGVYLSGNTIYSDGEKIMDRSDIRLMGMHNVANYMTAICAVRDYVSNENIRKVALNFGGVEHRIEYVREVNGVSYYNDSIGSSPARTTATLSAFEDKVILIAGGYDKHLSYSELGPVIKDRVKHLVLVGETSDKIEEAVKAVGGVSLERCTDFKDAVLKASHAAKNGDKVVLSPASASFDMFKDFEERGNRFKEIVNEL
ncbi:MAG: UDP-N-acetylmuramoyl-L-alanine--D-glutamate ligase [Bacillota bacterium]|nr:UDP-N-acetylmuramoyl-L-alanine--D-glutamate ligase [Bacillota bacterium]